jgi:hypothetical protein
MSTPDPITALVDVLCKIEAFKVPANRDRLLRQLPPGPVETLERSQALRTDLDSIVGVAVNIGRLPGGEKTAIDVLLDNSRPFFRGTSHEAELDRLRHLFATGQQFEQPRVAQPRTTGAGIDLRAIAAYIKQRRRAVSSIVLGGSLLWVGLSFSDWLPAELKGWLHAWHGVLIGQAALCFGGLALLISGSAAIWHDILTWPRDIVTDVPAVLKGPMAFTDDDGPLFRKLGREQELKRLLDWILDDQIRLVGHLACLWP